jgi:hypothetical protein
MAQGQNGCRGQNQRQKPEMRVRVLHAQTIQNFHSKVLPNYTSKQLDAREMPKAVFAGSLSP